MKSVRFKPVGWLHRPVMWQGFLAVALALGFCAQAFLAVDRRSHSASDTLFGVFPYVATAFLLLDWLASRTSEGAR